MGTERADRDLAVLDRADPLRDPLRERDPARRDPEEDQVVGALGAFDDLVGDARERAGDLRSVEDGACVVRSPCSGHLCDPLPRLTGRI